MSYLEKKSVAIGVGGGIAVYKVCELARQLMKRGANVRVVMTRNAQEFVAPLTFQALTGNPVLTDLFDPQQDATFGHLVTGKLADLFIVAPATANLIARIRAGMADDVVTTSLLAATCPILIAPAMNTAMWENPITQGNLQALLADARYRVVGPAAGALAEKTEGMGRLSEPPDIVEAAEACLAPQDLKGWKVLVTAGPTREHLDPVRYLSNPSSGRMGFAIARAAAQRGAQVTLVSGPSELRAPAGVHLVKITSAQEMADATLSRLPGSQLFVAAAAVADQRPEKRAGQKVKKQEGPETQVLVRTPDILASAAAAVAGDGPHRPLLVGFAAETERVVEQAREKLRRKQVDLIAANDVTRIDAGFAVDTNRLTLVDCTGRTQELPCQSKSDAADALLVRAGQLRRELGLIG
ncbi:MAG: bifunctional phosphopantothenoylcysteine decarboxylase/phosphopantothenate--cysteine ligase CoaBC [Deltaproteobacteria bacterium]|nr:bifunctional phosphopantothenoylcysteine decarboxylase/phosphopantothenate--cysteine ligase CoaBC [Deltaproteobacteria bacterium]